MNETRNLKKLFGRYELEEKIGSGGMAVVYRAYDPIRRRRVALKVLHSFLTTKDDTELKRRFHREAQIITQLDHPNIVHVYDFGEHEGIPYLAMEYMARGSLAERFEEPTPISLQTTAFLLSQVADGLDYAHAQGIIHRDIKLENVLLDDYNRPALTDFGIARVLDATRLTGTSVLVGTPLTMSPEQSLGNYPNLDYRSDLYSLAVMTYLMATGFFPFTGDEPLSILHKHLSALPPVPSRVNTTLPPEIDIVLLKGLAKEPGERYQSAGEFAAAFKEVVSQVETQTTSIIQITAANPITPSLTKLLSDTESEIITAPAFPIAAPPQTERRRYRPSDRGIGIVFALALATVAFLAGRLPILQSVAQAPSATPTLFDPNGTVGAIMLLTVEAYTDTPADTPSETPVPTFTDTPESPPTATDTPSQTYTPSATPTATASPTLIPDANGEVIAPVTINARGGPSTRDGVVFSLAPGTEVQLVGRTRDSAWLQVANEDGERGWVSARLLETTIPVSRLPVTGGEPTPTPTTTPTVTPRPTRPPLIQPTIAPDDGDSAGTTASKSKTPTPTATDEPPTVTLTRTPSRTPTPIPTDAPPTATLTRTPTPIPPTPVPPTPVPPTDEPPTPQPAIQISFSASPSQIVSGGCSTLSWSVANADVVYFEGGLAAFNGSAVVCPGGSDTYVVSASRNSDGAYAESYAAVNVVQPTAPPPPTDVPPPPTDVPPPPTDVPPPPTPEGTQEP